MAPKSAKAASKPPTPADTPANQPPADVLSKSAVVDTPLTPASPLQVGAPVPPKRFAYPIPSHLSPSTINNTESLLRFVILALICGAAIGSRLFAVIRFESVIHEL